LASGYKLEINGIVAHFYQQRWWCCLFLHNL